MQALKITTVNTASLHPMGRGSIESVVQSVKILPVMRKMLATNPTFASRTFQDRWIRIWNDYRESSQIFSGGENL